MGLRMQLSDRIGRRMKLHDLHVLMAVVQAGSMSKAAALLNTTQPAISRSIAELEHTIGVPLLDRNPQGVEPTEYGRILLDGGTAVFDQLCRRYPRIAIHLAAAGEVQTLHRELSERNVDLLIVRRFGPLADERLSFEFLFDDSFVVAAGAQSPWTRRRRIELAELAGEPWVLPPSGIVVSVATEAFGARGLDYPGTTVITDSPQVRMSLLATGRFLTF